MTDDAIAAATDHFERTPVAPGCIRILVQLGEQWHWHEMPVGDIWSAMVAFEKAQIPSMKLRRYSDIGCAKASVLMLAAADRGDSYEVSVASLWMVLRRREEQVSGHKTKLVLADIMSSCGGAWIITVADEIAEPMSMDFYVLHPDWRPGHPDLDVDLTPRITKPSIYDISRQGRAYH